MNSTIGLGKLIRIPRCLLLDLSLVAMVFLGVFQVWSQAPSLATTYANYYVDEDITIHFSGGPGNPKDWVGLYPEGVEPGPTPSTRWLYVDNTPSGSKGLKEGSLEFGGGLSFAGNWFAYLLLNDGYTILATNKFVLVDPGSPLVRANQRVYAPGQPISVSFTNGPGNAKDWVGIYLEGQTPGGGSQSTLWNYVDGTHNGTAALTSGSVTFPTGLDKAGNYAVYLLENDGYTILASSVLEVTQPASSNPRLLSIQPPNGATNQPPVVAFVATITNGTSKVTASSVTLLVDGVKAVPAVVQQADLTTIAYTNTSLYAPASSHTLRLVFADSASNLFTNETTFAVANYQNIVLPAPLYFENFDNTPEGELPAGWTEKSYTEAQNAEVDFGNLDSAAYAKWTVVNVDRFKGSFVTYSNPDGPQTEKEDYRRVLSVNPMVVVNGQVFQEPLAKGRFLFGDSGYRNGASQVIYVFTPDFDLRGKSNIYLSYHSLWEQNQDSLGAVEYSIDEGKNWLPVVYMLDRNDVLTVTNESTGVVSTDAVATFNAEYGDVARYINENGEEKGGTYGAFIAAPITQDLAPFISARVDDNPVESKRVELFRLPQADNQAKVRFRLAHAGTDSWYFGVDDFGLYSITSSSSAPPKLEISRSGSGLLISWPAGVSGYVLETSPALVNPSWSPVSGTVNNSISITPDAGPRFYRLRK